ncbi:Crp/Fnr family transcriptional regulator [Novosphingobium sp. G106]|uniref:Crp/Fnr family transcriptional regulator n=1 Tax=Novosphingobium sp. G106 TaxID=2849500 RepID=UPI001C2D8732|nr:Crp/Fnr family transcriptional regulator [Novosphingobium sp. G106]MBV1691941.1 Crp/Fnr family transcriptional regulator [Novosphingobium sp. G106]
MNACAQCSVRETAICSSLSPEELGALNSLGRHQLLRRGQTMVWQGDESLLVGNVIEGVLKLSSSTVDGREQTLGIIFPSDFIGRPFGPTATHSVVALTDAQVCTFRRSAFDEFAQQHPHLEHSLLQRTLTELDRTRQWMLLLGRKSATGRVASFLLEMAKRATPYAGAGGGAETIEFDLPLGRQDIADLLGLTIETVSRQLTGLRDQGIIAIPNRRAIEVLDMERLESCAEEA